MNWKNMSFGKKIAVGFGTVLTLLTLVGVLSFTGVGSIKLERPVGINSGKFSFTDTGQKHLTAGGGMVTAVASCDMKVKSIKINPDAVDPEDVEMLQDLILAAINDALTKSQEMVSGEMSKLTGGMNIPGVM